MSHVIFHEPLSIHHELFLQTKRPSAIGTASYFDKGETNAHPKRDNTSPFAFAWTWSLSPLGKSRNSWAIFYYNKSFSAAKGESFDSGR